MNDHLYNPMRPELANLSYVHWIFNSLGVDTTLKLNQIVTASSREKAVLKVTPVEVGPGGFSHLLPRGVPTQVV